MKNKWIQYTALVLTVFGFISASLSSIRIEAQKSESRSKGQKKENQEKYKDEKYKDDKLVCADDKDNNRLESQCEIREQTLSASPSETIAVNGLENGGIRIKGWDRDNILVRARVKVGAKSASEARELINRVKIETDGLNIRAAGPPFVLKSAEWNVEYEIFVPRQSNLSLETKNGGISVADANGRINFKSSNGGAVLRGLGGSVRGHVVNGGLDVSLEGDRWTGEGMDVTTDNGGVILYLPENYSARLVTGTKNGPLQLKIPVTAPSYNQSDQIVSADLGTGGATVRIISNNGSVVVKRP